MCPDLYIYSILPLYSLWLHARARVCVCVCVCDRCLFVCLFNVVEHVFLLRYAIEAPHKSRLAPQTEDEYFTGIDRMCVCVCVCLNQSVSLPNS